MNTPETARGRGLLRWYRSNLGHAVVGAVVLWAALPPWDLWPLAWIAPLWWVILIRCNELAGPPPFEHLQPDQSNRWLRALMAVLRWLADGRRPYRVLWLAGFLFWLAAIHWLRLPHPVDYFGWIALAFYLAFYLPVFVGLSRVAVHQLRVPVILAAPVVWTGLELARGHLLTGFTMASLGHTQYRWINLIQLSDLAGAYGVSFVVMWVAACLARMIPDDGQPRHWWKRCVWWPLLPAAALLGTAILYGHVRTSGSYTAPGARIALIQGSIDSEFKAKPHLREMIHQHYLLLSKEAVREFGDLDVIIWPETMYREPWITVAPNARMTDEFTDEFEDINVTPSQFRRYWEIEGARYRRAMTKMAGQLGVPLILGLEACHFGPEGRQLFNSAVFVPPTGEIQGPYRKMHLVPFGEYLPFAQYFPWVYELTPLSVGLGEGKRPVAFELNGLRMSPNVCYETVIPHLIRRQVNTLRAQGAEPDVLLNLTNDGWFWGSSELDMHLICGVFRAVECRKPLLIAANTGISARIDADGRIHERGPRRHKDPQPDAAANLTDAQRRSRSDWSRKYHLDWPPGTAKILTEVRLDRRTSWYLRHGDWPAGICLAACVILGLLGCWHQVRSRSGRNRGEGRKAS